MKITLRLRLITSFLLLITIPMLILGGVSYFKASKAIEKSVLDELKATSSKIAQSVSSKTKSGKDYLALASDNTDLAAAVSSKNKKVKAKAFKYIKKFCKQTNGIFEWVYITDVNGKDIVDSEGAKPNQDLSDREYVQEALKGKGAQSKDVLTSKMSGRPIVGAAYPLIKDGEVIGAVGGTILFKELTKDVSKVKIEASGYAFMIDKSGLILAHPNKKEVLNTNLSQTSNKALRSLVEKMKKGEKGEGYYTYGGKYKYMRFAPVGNWSLGVTVPYNEFMSSAIGIRNTTIILVILFLLLGSLVSTYTTHRIVKPIKTLEKLMKKAGDGDLTVESKIYTGDEIEELGKSFNDMIQHQARIVKRVRTGSVELAASSEGMAASSEEINATTEEISASMQEVAANSEVQNKSVIDVSQVLVQLSSLVQLAQVKAIAANKNSTNTMEAARKGRGKVDQTVLAIGVIETSTNETDKVMKALNELSTKVGGIIETINSLAEQTNLLALNAAIEAARAGEYGKGFTVVSDEIRKLSEQSNQGANEIGALVNQMILEIQNAVASMENAKKAVKNGVNITKETDESFLSIINAVEEIGVNIKDIVSVTKDEVATSDQIIKLIDSVASKVEGNTQMSEQVASAVEEQASSVEVLAATAEETSAMAVELESLVEKFKVEE